jgi:GNAT superfamily N-acetyltransferase
LDSLTISGAHLPYRNHNWFHSAKTPIPPVEVGTTTSKPHLTRRPKDRVKFYRALIKLTRLADGTVNVATIAATNEIAAILLWLPPNKRNGTDVRTLYRSGFLSLILPWKYGLRGLHRIDTVFEGNIKKMFSETLPKENSQLGRSASIKEVDCAFVQMLASNQAFAGKRYGSALFAHQLEQHFKEFPDRPVLLDTTTDQGIRAYEKLGFRILARTPVDTGTDESGFKLRKNATDEVRKKGRETCVQSVMIKLPPESFV